MKTEYKSKITIRMFSWILVVLILSCLTACGGAYSERVDQPNTKNNNLSESSELPSDAKYLLLEVMNNKKTFIAENGSETLFRDYKIPNVTDEIPIIAEEYAFVDLDGDNINELVVKCTTDYGLYMILHYDSSGGNVYGFSLGARSFMSVKVDGTFMGSGGAMINVISKVSFDKTSMSIDNIAVNNDAEKIYEVNGSPVSKQAADEYFSSWNKKQQPIWLTENIFD